MVPLDIISDAVCPWCYIGKARLDRALAGREGAVSIRWRPFQLNPDMPAGGLPLVDYLSSRFGKGRAEAMLPKIEALAEAEGIRIDFSRVARIPNTLDAHRVIRWAGEAGVQGAVVSALFRAYFAEGADISDAETLAGIAEDAGMERDVVLRLLSGETDRETVLSEEAEARAMGVGGVPLFLISGRYAVEGAQESQTWARILDELAALPISVGS